MWGQFKYVFNKIADIHVPLRTRKVRSKYAPWIDASIRQQINRDYLERKQLKPNLVIFKMRIEKLRIRRIIQIIKNSKLKYCQDYIDINNGNPKKMWDGIN